MGNACRSFGFDDDEGMRVFSITEMFLACYHIITASYVYRNIVEMLYKKPDKKDYELAILILGSALIFFLILHAIFGFLLYLKGWKERNTTICYVWMIVATINMFLSFCIALADLIGGSGIYWSMFFLYLLYVCFGVWVVRSFLLWAEENGYPKAICSWSCKCDFAIDDTPAFVTIHPSAQQRIASTSESKADQSSKATLAAPSKRISEPRSARSSTKPPAAQELKSPKNTSISDKGTKVTKTISMTRSPRK